MPLKLQTTADWASKKTKVAGDSSGHCRARAHQLAPLFRHGHARSLLALFPARCYLPLCEWTGESRRGEQVWEVVAELVSITARPRPVNPFQVHLAHVENLPAVHATLCKLAWHAPVQAT